MSRIFLGGIKNFYLIQPNQFFGNGILLHVWSDVDMTFNMRVCEIIVLIWFCFILNIFTNPKIEILTDIQRTKIKSLNN